MIGFRAEVDTLLFVCLWLVGWLAFVGWPVSFCFAPWLIDTKYAQIVSQVVVVVVVGSGLN